MFMGGKFTRRTEGDSPIIHREIRLFARLYHDRVKVLLYVWRSMRPRQWTKNLVVFAALLFAGQAGPRFVVRVSRRGSVTG